MKVDESTGEILEIGHGGLYAPLPIPAYNVLGNAGLHKAQTLLVCLCSFLGKTSSMIFPSYSTICRRSGLSRGQIKPNLDLLEEFGFIKVTRGSQGIRKKNNCYKILKSAYDVNNFNLKAREFMETNYMCKACGNQVNSGETRNGPGGRIHLGCGGQTFSRKHKQVKSKSLNKVPR